MRGSNGMPASYMHDLTVDPAPHASVNWLIHVNEHQQHGIGMGRLGVFLNSI